MRATRIAVSTVLLGALALPIASATTATAAPVNALTQSCTDPGPWIVGTKAVTIRSKASVKSTAVGILYRGHKFTVHRTSGNWRYITDRTTGVKGWVSAAYVYRDVPMCLD
ncbi:SH3 domain-containing protein [Streptomyces sp. CSDS2]|uniref:SH3 domain-containing protein n=1 Tax=Streptomyces sp. CSDS2 TaxID=3055051 RepID=UPI0025B0E596|nr:SH3 domain-containing protein [Streptomyces sp. CSDS2]MDN3265662.1 SH3 domain-containing protein [Streptomyces sp. CSDS2]